jgi:RNA polymerase sigma factor (sigma-70 family)
MAELLHNDALVALRPAVRALVAHVLGARLGEADVEDCTSEAFRRALEGHGRLIDGAALRPWLLGIARHVALDALRSRMRELQRNAPAVRESSADGVEPIDRLAHNALGPHERAELAERTRHLQRALAALPEPQRRALALHAEGQGYREIALVLEVPIGTVCTWIARARRALARGLNAL